MFPVSDAEVLDIARHTNLPCDTIYRYLCTTTEDTYQTMSTNLITIRIHNECGDELVLTNVFESGAIVHDDRVVVNLYGREANISIEELRKAVNSLEAANNGY